MFYYLPYTCVQILNQFVLMSDWGELDYLIIDMPPGTGDIQLTLAQIMNISAAVIVTTPQKLSFVDVVKGIDMFDTVNVPSVAIVENMADYSTYSFSDDFFESLGAQATQASLAQSGGPADDPSLAAKQVTDLIRKAVEQQRQPRRIFGNGHIRKLKEMWGMENIVSLPLLEELSVSGDSGVPYVLSHPNSELAQQMATLAAGVAKEVERLSKNAGGPVLTFDEPSSMLSFDGDKFTAFDFRCDCRCAVCIEEMTGVKLLDRSTVNPEVKPMGMSPIGRYAMSVDWSDGHKSLYPFRQIAKLATPAS
jgi:MinD-like ATPase involved in chromosome partitioning or flagellar assembly